MADTKEAKVGIADAQELLPDGRIVYEAVRNHLIDRPTKFSVLKKSPAAVILDRVASDHLIMEPPLPKEVVQTVENFARQYQAYVFGEGYGDLSSERRRLEDVAEQLISVVFEYGYGNILPTSTSNPDS